MNKYEKLIEYIISEQEEKARELFHQIVVEKSRSIYENLVNEIDQDDTMDREVDEVEDLVDEIGDDELLPEAEHEDEEEGDEDEGMEDESEEDESEEDMGMDDEEDMDMGDEEDMGDEGLEDRVMDLETALDDLKAEFDKLMADEANEPEHADIMGGDDMDMDSDMDMDQEPNMVREYTEKVSAGHGVEKKGAPEGHEVGHGKSASVNKQSIVASANKMGGTAANIARGGAETAPDGQKPHGKAGGFVKPAQELDVAKRNVNKPGGNKGAQNFYGKKETSYEGAHGAEGQTTAGKMPVDTKSLVSGKVR